MCVDSNFAACSSEDSEDPHLGHFVRSPWGRAGMPMASTLKTKTSPRHSGGAGGRTRRLSVCLSVDRARRALPWCLRHASVPGTPAGDTAAAAGAKLAPGSPCRGIAAGRACRGEPGAANFNRPTARRAAGAAGRPHSQRRHLAAFLPAAAGGGAGRRSLPPRPSEPPAAGPRGRSREPLSGGTPQPPGAAGRRLRAAAARCRPRAWRRPQPAGGRCLF